MAIYKQYQEYVTKASEKYGVDENLIWAVIEQESSGNSQAVSNVGAQGLMQLMPYTAKELGVKNPFDPEQNIMGGTKLLSQMLNRWDGDTEAALASYVAGSGNVKRYGKEKYAWYYEGVLSKMDTSTIVSTSSNKGSSTKWNGFIIDDNMKWWGDALVIIFMAACLILSVVFVYLAINGGMPDASDIVNMVLKGVK